MAMGILRWILAFWRVLLGPRASPAAENLALRQQLLVLHRSVNAPSSTRSLPSSVCSYGPSIARTPG